jgi:hypothetical protein
VQEAGVHAWDAEDTVGRAGSLGPPDLAADGVDEFLSVEVPTNGAWAHPPVTVGLAATDGPDGWVVTLTSAGGQVARGPAAGDAVLGGPAGDLVLALYGRRPIETLTVTGDEQVAARFLGWFTTE